MSKPSDQEENRKTGFAYAAGITLFAVVVTFCGLGYLLDRWLGTDPWLLIADIVDFRGHIVFDAFKPDGAPRKLLDSSRLRALGWRHTIGLRAGIEELYARWKSGDRRTPGLQDYP